MTTIMYTIERINIQKQSARITCYRSTRQVGDTVVSYDRAQYASDVANDVVYSAPRQPHVLSEPRVYVVQDDSFIDAPYVQLPLLKHASRESASHAALRRFISAFKQACDNNCGKCLCNTCANKLCAKRRCNSCIRSGQYAPIDLCTSYCEEVDD